MSTLERCPPEIIDSILWFLNWRDICAFRLTSRGLARRASSAPSLRTHLQKKHVDVTDRSLRALVDATGKPNRLGCLIQDLVLVGVVNNTKFLTRQARDSCYTKEGTVARAKAQQDLEILTRRQQEYETMHASRYDARKSPLPVPGSGGVSQGCAEETPPTEGGGWKLIWQAATDTFHTALAALAASGIHIQNLDVYNSIKRCSLACNEPSAVNFGFNALATSLASLKTLAVSFSDRIINVKIEDVGDTGDSADSWLQRSEGSDASREFEDIEAEACDESTYSGLPALVQRCRGLESLELHHFELSIRGEDELNRHRERVLQRMAETVSLPPLKRLVLRGFRFTSADLLTVLVRLKPTLRELSLQNVILLEGANFGPIFDYCTSEDAGFERLCLENLLEPGLRGPYMCRHLVYFTGEPNQEPKLQREDLPRHGSNTVERAGAAQIRRPIPYFTAFVANRYLGSSPRFYPNIRGPYSPWLHGRGQYGPPL
ncbi:hypothetical protein BJX99DRAFT_260369 [Aspergillus californicus]